MFHHAFTNRRFICFLVYLKIAKTFFLSIFFRDKAYLSDYISPYKRSANNIHKVLVKKMTFIYPVLYFDATTHLNYATLTWK